MPRAALAPLTIHMDSREPHPDAGDRDDALFGPWRVDKGQRVDLTCARVTLREGDYAPVGFAAWKAIDSDTWAGEPWMVFERKSLSDAISTIVGGVNDALGEATSNRDRFAEELGRMRDYAFRCVVIEGTPGDVQRAAEDPRRRFNPLSVLASYAAFAPRFGVQVWWAGSRPGAEWYIGETCARAWSEYIGGPACRKAIARGDRMPWIGKGIVLP